MVFSSGYVGVAVWHPELLGFNPGFRGIAVGGEGVRV